MRHVTANIRHGMSTAHLVSDVHAVAGLGDCIGWQEIDTGRYRSALKGLGPGWRHYFAGGELALSWRTDRYRLIDKGCDLTHHGKAHVSPNRYIQWVLLEDLATGHRFIRWNTHAVSGGWSHGDRPTTEWRQRMWHLHMTILAAKIRGWLNAGYPVIGGGDTNRDGYRFLGALVTYEGDLSEPTHGRSRYDFLVHADTDALGFEVTACSIYRGHLWTDHDPVVAGYDLTEKEASMSVGFMPGAIHKPIAPGANDPRILPCGVVFHVAVSRQDSLHDYFDGPSGGIESHFYVRFDGTIEQYRSIFFEADAESRGNSFIRGGTRQGFVSVETEGMGEGEWTPEQIASLKAITLFVEANSHFPLRVAPAYNSPGVGYHCLHREWNPNGHSCPGPDRIKQFHQTIEPWLRAGAPHDEEDDMQVMDLMHHNLTAKDGELTVAMALRDAQEANAKLTKVLALLDVDSLAEKVAAKVSVSTSLTADEVKQAVKDALAEGVE